MRIILRLSAVVVLVLAGWAVPPLLVQAAFLDTTADRVFGQPDFTHNSLNRCRCSTASASSLANPTGAGLEAGQRNGCVK
jgi:hypothetical protein